MVNGDIHAINKITYTDFTRILNNEQTVPIFHLVSVWLVLLLFVRCRELLNFAVENDEVARQIADRLVVFYFLGFHHENNSL